MVSNASNLILRHSGFIDPASLSTSLIRVIGSKSGEHAGEFILSDDGKTMVFNPTNPFAGNEEVHVTLEKGILALAGAELTEYAFSFKTAPEELVQLPDPVLSEGNS